MGADLFPGLVAIVQYRRNSVDYDPWHNMAAFDSRTMADTYCAQCAAGTDTWEYQAVDVPSEEEAHPLQQATMKEAHHD